VRSDTWQAFEHSANYDSVTVFGNFHPIEDADERLAAFQAFSEKLLPGRWGEVRGPNPKELKARAILAIARGAGALSRAASRHPAGGQCSPAARFDTVRRRSTCTW